MDFFREQDRARAKTAILVFLFFAAVIAIASLIWGVVGIIIIKNNQYANPWTWQTYLISLGGISIFIGLCSLYRMLTLCRGGHAVAAGLDCEIIHSNTKEPQQRQLINIVEEMAIAAGIPIPEVYIMNQRGINAFAAGTKFENAIIAVTDKALEKLSRDEMQGVVAHEISHILNGDMKLNMRLSGVLFGLVSIAILGRFIFYISLHRSYYRRLRLTSGSNKNNNTVPLLFIGLALMAIGSLGVFVGNIIKAAISRQREFLADASAVQFTRNPDGIAGALKKIYSYVCQSDVEHHNATNFNHLFLGAASRSWFSFLSTHPPLETRILTLDPQWDGKPLLKKTRFPLKDTSADSQQQKTKFTQAALMASIGSIPADAVANTQQKVETLDHCFKDFTRSLELAPAFTLALLINDQDYALQQQKIIANYSPRYTQLEQIFEQIFKLNRKDKFLFLQLSLVTIKQLDSEQIALFIKKCKELIKLDKKVDIFEWVVYRIIVRNLIQEDKPDSINSLTAAHFFLQTLAQSSDGISQHIYQQACREINLEPRAYTIEDKIDFIKLQQALYSLGSATNSTKKKLLDAACYIITYDSVIDDDEFLLMQAFCYLLGVPLPSFL